MTDAVNSSHTIVQRRFLLTGVGAGDGSGVVSGRMVRLFGIARVFHSSRITARGFSAAQPAIPVEADSVQSELRMDANLRITGAALALTHRTNQRPMTRMSRI